MQLILTDVESDKIFHEILCNIVCGSNYFADYGIILEFDHGDYAKAKTEILLNPFASTEETCIEDVLMQMLKNGCVLTFKDEEEGENNATVSRTSILESLNKITDITCLQCILMMLDENGDADAGDNDIVLQHILYNEVIFG